MLKNEKVEWKELWEVTSWDKKFNGVERYKQEKVDKYHYYLAGELKELASETGNVKILTTNHSDLYANEFNVKENISIGEVVCIPWGGNPIVQYYNGKFITADNRIARSLDKNILNVKYLYYYLLNKINYIAQLYRGSGIKHPDMKKVLDIKIPIPSLEMQEKIVKTLDKFTNYVTELQSELQSRNKQYEYYRDKLLSEEHLNKLTNNSSLYKDKYELRKVMMKDVCEIKRGRVMSKQYLEENIGKYPVFSSQTLNNGKIGSIKTYDFDGEYITWTTDGAYAGTVFYRDGKFSVTNVCGIMKNKKEKEFLLKYIYYYLQIEAKKHVKSGSGNPKLMSNVMEQIKIIYPPIEIQEKIVEILDKFQALTQDVSGLLPDEIEKREKQYEYYREKLLTFDTERTRGGYQVLSKDYISLLTQAGDLVGVNVFELEKKKLEEVCEILDSKRKPIKKSKRIKGIYPYYGANGIQDYVNDFIFDGSFVLMGEDGSVIDKNNNPILHWVNNKKIWVNNHAHVLKNKDDFINIKYIYYSLSISDVSSIVKGTPPKINQANLRNIKILIPPLPIQEYIVSILDKFEALSQSTTEGLRREIELREKQYEYYSEKLLTFKK